MLGIHSTSYLIKASSSPPSQAHALGFHIFLFTKSKSPPMSSAALLNQDFGSESEDDNFNPAPADDSDNEAAGNSDDEVSPKPATNGNSKKQLSVGKNNEDGDGEDGTEANIPLRGNGLQAKGHQESRVEEEDEEDINDSPGDDVNGADNDEDDEDEEDEEAVVCLNG